MFDQDFAVLQLPGQGVFDTWLSQEVLESNGCLLAMHGWLGFKY
jgi:hypothetical protein